MQKNTGLALFLVFLLILLLLVWLRTGSIVPPSGSDAIWFNAGLFALLIGGYVIEYRFTRPNDVFVNCVIAFASISTLNDPPLAAWWESLKWGALICGGAALAIAWDPGLEARFRSANWRNAIYHLVNVRGKTHIGKEFDWGCALIPSPVDRLL